MREYRYYGEPVEDFHKRLLEKYGCENCSEYGNNGCGNWEIGGYRFNDDGVEPINADDWFWQCHRMHDSVCAASMTAFQDALDIAISFAPCKSVAQDCYGDIVRSAAAVAVAAIGGNSRD